MVEIVRKRLGKTLSIQVIFEYLEPVLLLELQRLNKRYYNSMVIGLIPKIILWRGTSVVCKIHTASIKVLDAAKLKWTEVEVVEEGDESTKEERLRFFAEKSRDQAQSNAWSKIVQVNKTDVYFMGGR